MIYFVFLVGVLFGAILSNILRFEHAAFGVFRIDHREETCQVCLNTEDIMKTKKNKIILKIDHDADLSQK